MPRLPLLLLAASLALPAGAAAPPDAPRIVVVSPAPGAPASPAAPGQASPRAVPVISLSVRDADLVEVVRSFARIAGVNLIVDPGVSGKVTAELVNVRWDLALSVILKTQGLAMELDGRILTVAEPRRLIKTR